MGKVAWPGLLSWRHREIVDKRLPQASFLTFVAHFDPQWHSMAFMPQWIDNPTGTGRVVSGFVLNSLFFKGICA